jgi:nitroreductase
VQNILLACRALGLGTVITTNHILYESEVRSVLGLPDNVFTFAARQHLHLIQPMRLFKNHQHRYGDGHVLATRSRFIQDGLLKLFERRAHGEVAQPFGRATAPPNRVDSDAKHVELGAGPRTLV